MANEDVRASIEEARLRYWQVARLYGCSDGNFSRRLRHELPPAEKRRILEIVQSLKEAK